MNLNDLIMVKLLSFLLCDNVWMRVIILMFFVLDLLSKRKKIKKSKNKENILIGNLLIFLNEILNLNLILINFLFLGLMSSFLVFLKKDRLISIYFLLIVIEGGIFFCLNL